MGLKELTLKMIHEWEQDEYPDEWFFCDYRQGITGDLSPEDAYASIPDAIDLVLSQSDTYICGECFQLLLDIVHVTDKGKIHPDMLSRWDELTKHVSALGEYYSNKIEALKSWYMK